MDERDTRGVTDPARSEERPRIDLVDHDVECAAPFVVPELSRSPINAEPAAAANDLEPSDRLAFRSSFYRCCEERHSVSSLDQAAGDLVGEHLGASGRGMREVLPVVDQDPHALRASREV